MSPVLVIQPSTPAYRRRFFQCLASQIDLQLLCSEKSLDGASSDLAGLEFPYEIVPWRPIGRHAAWQSGVVRRLLRDPPAILVINGNPRYLSSMIAMIIARLRGIPVVWWGHGMSATSRPTSAGIRQWLMGLANRIFVYYPEEVSRLQPSLRQRASGVDNSFDTAASLAVFNSLQPEDIARFRESAGIGDDPLILTIGRLTDKARVDLLIEAMRKLQQRGVGVQLGVLGGGELADELKSQVADSGLADRVLFAGPVFDEAEIGKWMRASQLFVYGGAVGLSLIHAFSYALPAVIAAPLSGHMPEALLFHDGVNGASFDSGDAASLADAIAELLAAPGRLEEMGANAQQLVRERLSAEKMAENFVRGLEGLQ